MEDLKKHKRYKLKIFISDINYIYYIDLKYIKIMGLK